MDLGEDCLVMGDINAAINPCTNPVTRAAKNLLEWEGTGEIRILNDKNEPTHDLYIRGQKKSCLDVIMIIPGL